MTLRNQRELKNTREKLRKLEEHFAARKQAPAEDAHIRALSLRSLKQLINQLKEEIARYEAHLSPGARGR
jgi:uncharacterized small protein (DUF1192 family)